MPRHLHVILKKKLFSYFLQHGQLCSCAYTEPLGLRCSVFSASLQDDFDGGIRSQKVAANV